MAERVKLVWNCRNDFRKAHSTEHVLFTLFQKWQKELNSSGIVETILMDLSKAYDCLLHDLIIAN